MIKKLIFCVDFDGTVVTHEFPKVGRDVPGAAEVLRELTKHGHRLILWTMRSDGRPNGDFLKPAVEWYERNGIPLFGVNENPEQKEWTTSPKAFGNVFIDDAALGCPLRYSPGKAEKPYVDWVRVREHLVWMNALPHR